MALRQSPTRRSTLYVFDGDEMFLAELDLTEGLQLMLGLPIGHPHRWLAWAGVLNALQAMVDNAR